MPRNLRRAFLYWLGAYWLVTAAGTVLTIVLGYALDLPAYWDTGVAPIDAPAYLASEPFHPFFNLIVFVPAARLCLRTQPRTEARREALRLGTFWLVLSLLLDLVLFVLIPHPFAASPHRFYVEYQPWITLVYATVFLSPLLASALDRRPVS